MSSKLETWIGLIEQAQEAVERVRSLPESATKHQEQATLLSGLTGMLTSLKETMRTHKEGTDEAKAMQAETDEATASGELSKGITYPAEPPGRRRAK